MYHVDKLQLFDVLCHVTTEGFVSLFLYFCRIDAESFLLIANRWKMENGQNDHKLEPLFTVIQCYWMFSMSNWWLRLIEMKNDLRQSFISISIHGSRFSKLHTHAVFLVTFSSPHFDFSSYTLPPSLSLWV